jgi:hypothetical protein
MSENQDPQPETPPKVLSPEEISAIPPELQKKLNIIPDLKPGEDTDGITPEVMAKVRAISTEGPLAEAPGGFSWAALVYGPFYYWAMGDTLFAIVSAAASLLVYTAPLLIPLAFYARARAWERKEWESREAFWQAQRQWDRTAIIGGVLALIFLYFIYRFVFSTLASTFGTSNPNDILKQVQETYQ